MLTNILTIVVMCRDRQYLAKQAIESAINQFVKTKVIISNNSTTGLVKDMVDKNFKGIDYYETDGKLTVFEHFKYAIKLSKTKYVTIFHDDDIMCTNYTYEIIKYINENENENENEKIAAISTNAIYINEKNESTRNEKEWFDIKYEEIIINDAKKLLKYYFEPEHGGIAPWSMYCYNKNKIELINCSEFIGKNSDLIILLKLLNHGNIIWINKKLGKIREHNNSLTNTISVSDYKQVINWTTKNVKGVSKYQIINYRYWNLYILLKNKGNSKMQILRKTWRSSLYLLIFCNYYRKKIINLIFKRIT